MSTTRNNLFNTIPSITTQQPWEKSTRRRSIIREFALNTSTHALPGIARSQSKHNRIFWTISFILFTCVMIFFIVQSIMNYFAYQTQTTIEVVVERNQVFPAVTVCNACPGRYDLLKPAFINFTNSKYSMNLTDKSPFTPEMSLYLRDFLIEMVNTNQDIKKYLFALETMLISCDYNDIRCNSSDFISFVSPNHGLCFTFNARLQNGSESSLRRVNENGRTGKLKLRFYVNNHLFVPLILDGVSSGIVAMLHDNAEVPLIDIAAIELSPGRKHKLGFRKKANYFLPPPYTSCTSTVSDVMQHTFKQYGGADYKYSQGVCYNLCKQAYVFKICGCVNQREWLAQSVKLENTSEVIDAPLCNLRNECQDQAMINISSSNEIWEEYCSHCEQECVTIDYRVTPSAVSAPDTDWSLNVKSFVEKSNVPLPQNWSMNWQSEIQQNFIAVDIVCETTLIENYTQEASMNAVDVLSNVGGQTGLWIGISFLSVMEVVEMLYRLLRHEIFTLKRRIQNRFRP